MPKKTTVVIACETVIEEMLPILPEDMAYQVLDFGLHLIPNNLRKSLQEAIDRAAQEYETVILGYGLCSLAVIGLQANGCRLVIPRVDDCIAIFLGSHSAYMEQSNKEPGTYYLTKGWIEVGDTPFDEYEHLVVKYGRERADHIMSMMLKHYTRLAYIDTGQKDQERYRAYARKIAAQFNLRYEEIKGSSYLVSKTLFGPWDDDFVVVEPGNSVAYVDFKRPQPSD
jgi:hypothetical protein